MSQFKLIYCEAFTAITTIQHDVLILNLNLNIPETLEEGYFKDLLRNAKNFSKQIFILFKWDEGYICSTPEVFLDYIPGTLDVVIETLLQPLEPKKVLDPYAQEGVTLDVCLRHNWDCCLSDYNLDNCRKIAEKYEMDQIDGTCIWVKGTK